MKRFLFIILAISLCHTSMMAQAKKREFRGAWIQAVNGQWTGVGRDQMQRTLTYQLDELQKDGVNAIFFQVRPECDALYQSSIEPWSRFLTAQQGLAPRPYWDPLQWMIEQCHKRGMELHAWINPYRAKTKTTNELAQNHVAVRHPERVFSYDGQFILNPALPENRELICHVCGDIMRRYDIDGLHYDDYFYPYPVAGQPIPDQNDFARNPRGFKNIGDWRRDNVNLFVKQLHDTVRAVKPWVKVGVSPFGIYRNMRSSEIGSNTNGLQNYDDLYADILLWVDKGWVDYCVPQIYWEIGNKAADYETLIKWWNQYCSKRPLFIGEDVERTVKFADKNNPQSHQMNAKYNLHAQLPNVQGTVLWYAKAAVDNVGNYGTMLRQVYWKTPALQPLMPWIDKKAPKKVKGLKMVDFGKGPMLMWQAPKGKTWKDKAERYVVYRFPKGVRVDLNDASRIVAITSETFYELPTATKDKTTWAVTSLDRVSNESKAKKKKY
ncbi:MAG: family 10 glycosylhydrolase [Prevotella sp.]|nr:family 10 glycosylhydrolase [Prevotella sp.]